MDGLPQEHESRPPQPADHKHTQLSHGSNDLGIVAVCPPRESQQHVRRFLHNHGELSPGGHLLRKENQSIPEESLNVRRRRVCFIDRAVRKQEELVAPTLLA